MTNIELKDVKQNLIAQQNNRNGKENCSIQKANTIS